MRLRGRTRALQEVEVKREVGRILCSEKGFWAVGSFAGRRVGVKKIVEDFWVGDSIAGWVGVLVAGLGFPCNFPFLNNYIFHATYLLILSLPIPCRCSLSRRELSDNYLYFFLKSRI